MKQARLSLPSESPGFISVKNSHLVGGKPYISTDVRDLSWVRTNIPCQAACPVQTDIPGYIQAIIEERYGDSYELNRFANIFPASLGRICSRPCEAACRHGWKENGESVAICNLKRVAADHKSPGHRISEKMFGPTGKSVAIVGSGPAGLTLAHDLAIFGHKVTIFEALPEAGGMLLYGIPDFRLPREVIKPEVDNILRLGIDIHLETRVGQDVKLEDMLKENDAVVMAAGTYRPNVIKIPGADLPGVFTGLDFMMRVNKGEKINVGKIVQVIGGGYTAMDCARSAMRLGAKRAIINVLTSEEYLLVEKHELFQVKFERVEFSGLVSIQAVKGNGKVEGVVFKRNRLGGYLPNGEREGIPIKGSDFEQPADTVIMAIGQQPDTEFVDVKIDKSERGLPTMKPGSFMTSRNGLFVAGDFATGAKTIIESIGSGRRAAVAVDQFLVGSARRRQVVVATNIVSQHDRKWDSIPRQDVPNLKLDDRFAGAGFAEVESGLDKNSGKEEAKRCYLCHQKYEIDVSRCIYCRWCIDVMPRHCIVLGKSVRFNEDGGYAGIEETENWREVAAISIDNDQCIRCNRCLEVCPTQCIQLVKMEWSDTLIAGGEEV